MGDLPYNPRQIECQKCRRSKEVCNLDFKNMPNCGIYAGISIIVICTEFVERVK